MMNHKSIMLNEISQTQKTIQLWTQFIGNSLKDLIIVIENRLVVARQWRKD